MRTLRPVLLAWCLLLAVSAPGPGRSASPAPPVFLLDQFDRPFSLHDARGNVVVLLASGRAGAEQSRAWGKQLFLRYGQSIVILGVADLRPVPFFLRAWIRNYFSNDPVRVLLDWTGAVFSAYGIAGDRASLILVDRRGELHRILSGKDTVAAAFRELDRMLRH